VVTVEKAALPEVGDRYVWEIPSFNFGPVFMTVRRVIKGGQAPRVIFDCIGTDGRPWRKPHRHFLPLPDTVRRQDWTEDDIRKADPGAHQ